MAPRSASEVEDPPIDLSVPLTPAQVDAPADLRSCRRDKAKPTGVQLMPAQHVSPQLKGNRRALKEYERTARQPLECAKTLEHVMGAPIVSQEPSHLCHKERAHNALTLYRGNSRWK